MVRPGLRSGALKKISKRIPGGGSEVFYLRRKHNKAIDPVSNKPLNGVPLDPKYIRRGAKTRKRPERIFGGVLSPSTLATALKVATRNME